MNKDEIKKIMEGQIKTERQGTLIKKTNIPDPKRICINNIDKIDESVLECIEAFKNESIVYIIMLKNKLNDSTSPQDIEKLFSKKKANYGKDKWWICGVNRSHWKSDSRCLYVGKSHKKIMTRMKQHLAIGDLSRKTYSFWLKDWFGESKLPQEIEIYFLVLKDISPNDVYMIEDLLWRGLSPLFGHSGKSPKSKKC